MTDQVMAAIHDLSGQTYIEAYGTSVKSGSLTSTEADARILERPGINTRPPRGRRRLLGRVRRAGRACRDLSVAAERWRCSPSTRALRFEAPVPTAYCDPGVDAFQPLSNCMPSTPVQQPTYADTDLLNRVTAELRKRPPLVFAGDCLN